MLTPEELIKQRNEIIRKQHELHVYLMESRKLQGDISEITYKYNSGIEVSDEQLQRKERLQTELREKKDELRRCYHLAPGGVELQIRECNHALARIDSQLEALEKQGIAQKQQMELNCHGSEGSGNRLAEYAGLYTTPEGQ